MAAYQSPLCLIITMLILRYMSKLVKSKILTKCSEIWTYNPLIIKDASLPTTLWKLSINVLHSKTLWSNFYRNVCRKQDLGLWDVWRGAAPSNPLIAALAARG